MFGISRARFTLHDRAHEIELQPEAGRSSDHVVVHEAVIRLGDEQYWPYAAVGPETERIGT